MSKIRVPSCLLSSFKAFCKSFSLELETATGVRLRGNKLLNLVAQASGHANYKSLLIDSGTYGEGRFDWDILPGKLAEPLAESLDLPAVKLWPHLMKAVSMQGEAIDEMNEKMKASENPFRAVSIPQLALTLTSQRDSFAHLFESVPGDIDMQDVINQNDGLVIDLQPVSAMESSEDKSLLLKLLGDQYSALNSSLQKRVVFLGGKKDVMQFLQANLKHTSGLLNNPSIATHQINVVFAASDSSCLANLSEEDAETIMLNANHKVILKGFDSQEAEKEELVRTRNYARSAAAQNDYYFSLGERFAGRQRPITLENSVFEIEAIIERTKTKVTTSELGAYDLQDFANQVYFDLNNTNGFSSSDLAGWLLDSGRRLGLAFSFGGGG